MGKNRECKGRILEVPRRTGHLYKGKGGDGLSTLMVAYQGHQTKTASSSLNSIEPEREKKVEYKLLPREEQPEVWQEGKSTGFRAWKGTMGNQRPRKKRTYHDEMDRTSYHSA